MIPKSSRILFMAVALILVAGLVVQSRRLRDREPVATATLASRLTPGLRGWIGRDLPVSDSPEVRRAMETTLRYDDVLYREYRKGERVVEVYVNAWQPGKMDPREIAIHHPDNCWTANGFTRLDEASKAVHEIGGRPVATGQFRRFEARGKRLEVAYWLMVDGKPFAMVDESTRTRALLTRLIAFGRTVWLGLVSKGKRSPIYFVRVSSSGGLEAELADPELQPLINSLMPLIADAPEPR